MNENEQLRPDSPPPKGTFFCPACDYSGRMTEALVCQGSGTDSACCPACETPITARQRLPPITAERDGASKICHSD